MIIQCILRCYYISLCPQKNRTQTPCFWETQPGGCQKPHCVFFHRKPNQAPQRAVAVPTVPVASTSTSLATEVTETVSLKTEAKVVDQKTVAVQKAPAAPLLANAVHKAPAAPISAVMAAEDPPAAKPTKGLEAPPLIPRRPENGGGRTVVTSINGVTLPKKVVIKKDEPMKNVKGRLMMMMRQ